MTARDLRYHIIKLSQILVLCNPGSLCTTFGNVLNYCCSVISTVLLRPLHQHIFKTGSLQLWRMCKSFRFVFYFQEGSSVPFTQSLYAEYVWSQSITVIFFPSANPGFKGGEENAISLPMKDCHSGGRNVKSFLLS